MQTEIFNVKFVLTAILLVLVFLNFTLADSKSYTPAGLLAKQSGATQFEEEHFEAHTNCTDAHKHHLKKRSSDEDVDYEVYQGVVGRPGIDFPIYPRIPKTSFSCRSFGNGYFADMDTDCQVFHICEEGRKISFLCPNGTIFQQSELTCDWWFKVNCLGSPSYYSESAEILNKQRIQRVRPSVPVQGFNIVGGGLNIRPKVTNSVQHARHNRNKSERRIDSNEEEPVDSVDFDDLSSEKQLKGEQHHKVISNIDNNNNEESQITAESSSFVGANRFNGYDTPKTSKDNEERGNETRGHGRNGASRRGQHEQGSTSRSPSHFGNQSTERARSGKRGNQRFKEENKPLMDSAEKTNNKEGKPSNAVVGGSIRYVEPARIIDSVIKSSEETRNLPGIDDKSQRQDAKPTRTVEKIQITTPQFPMGTYSTAKRIELTKSTPFYTPTVPSVKAKGTDSKVIFIKSKDGTDSSVTPNPNHLSGGSISSFNIESIPATKPTSNSAKQGDADFYSTLKPFVIGMRHYHDILPESQESLDPNLNWTTQKSISKETASDEYLPTSTLASATRPTYLPKGSSVPKAVVDAGGDLLLFAPNPVSDENVTRNVNEMLKTMSIIKGKLEDADEIKFQRNTRIGLEIPPSSGPDALVSLAKYFAAEQKVTANNLNRLNKQKQEKTHTVSTTSTPSSSLKPSDTTSTLTTAAIPSVSVKAGDIKTSLLSEKTVSKYSNLFGLKDIKGRSQTSDINEGILSNLKTNISVKEKEIVSSPFPQIGSTDSTIRHLAEKPESRKIAQVFSNALTTYLKNPETFREKLAAARPTEPPSLSGRVNINTEAVTENALFKSGTAATYLPTKPTPLSKMTSSQINIAAEINQKFDFSTQLPDLASTTEIFDGTTFKPISGSIEQGNKLELSAELIPPSPDSGEGEEFLQREQTQSFVKSRNELNLNQHTGKKSQKNQAAYKPTENPWNHVAQTDFLDPLTINDALMKETKTTTLSPYTYLPKESTTQLPSFSSHEKLQRLETPSTGLRVSKTAIGIHTDQAYTWHDIFRSYDIPVETLPSNSGLQRIANKLFGGLNETEAQHLKNVMQQAEHDRQVLSLLLLLIQTCDDQNGRALERSRKHLLSALIDMDGKLQSTTGKIPQLSALQAPRRSTTSTTTTVPVTTYRRDNEALVASTTPFMHTTTDLPTTTSGARSGLGSSAEETTKFEIRVEDPGEEYAGSTVTPTKESATVNSDQRALELLKSLYSLASKFQSRR